jgi:predicted nucleic acid-binding protein
VGHRPDRTDQVLLGTGGRDVRFLRLLLDTAVLGEVCHPRKYGDVRGWLARVVIPHEILISEIADYELRRELSRIGSHHSLARLDELTRELSYVPMATSTWRAAAKLWATLRRGGIVTAAPTALDGDVLIAAQAISEGATVVTPNVRHFEPIVPAFSWRAVPL